MTPFTVLNFAKFSYIFLKLTGKVVAIIIVYTFLEIRLAVVPNRL